MEKTIKILVLNNGKTVEVPLGANLEEVYQQSGLQMKYGPISAHVNNKVEGMHFRIYKQKQVEFLDVTSSSGNRAYTRARLHTNSSTPVRWPSTSLYPTVIM